MHTPIAAPAQPRETRTSIERSAPARETRLRLRLAWTLTICSLMGFAGAAWDVQWHAAVGRDTFLTPPHLLIYTATGLSGLLALGVVLFYTWRARRAAGDPAGVAGTSRVLWWFRAPFGVIMAGFGVLASVAAAPLDAIWHEQYGIDVTLWAPFHVMAITGSTIVGLGTLYLFADVLRREAAAGAAPAIWRGWRVPQVGLALRAGLALAVALLLAIPALEEVPFIKVGGAALSLHPLIAALLIGALLAATMRAVGRPGAALLFGLGYSGLLLLVNWLVPLAVAGLVAFQGAAYRATAPSFTVVTAAFPTWLLASCVLAEAVAMLSRRRGAAPWKGLLLAGALAGGLSALIEPLWRRAALLDAVGQGSASLLAAQAAPSALWVSALGAALLGALGAALGLGLGVSLESTRE